MTDQKREAVAWAIWTYCNGNCQWEPSEKRHYLNKADAAIAALETLPRETGESDLREALAAWDKFQPYITTPEIVSQANAMAEAIRTALSHPAQDASEHPETCSTQRPSAPTQAGELEQLRAQYAGMVCQCRDQINAASQREAALRTALEETQGLLVAMLIEKRPDEEIEAQINDNRTALATNLGEHS